MINSNLSCNLMYFCCLCCWKVSTASHQRKKEKSERGAGECVISAQDRVGERNKGRNELISYLVSGVLIHTDLQWAPSSCSLQYFLSFH